MNIMTTSNEIKQKYIKNDRPGFKLKNKDDLLKIHNIKFESIQGVERFDIEVRKTILLPFLINFMNAWGLEARDTIKALKFDWIPKSKCASFVYKMYGNEGWVHIRSTTSWD